jgi:hypothetical protein
MNLKEIIEKANQWIKENNPTQGNWDEEFIFDFPIEILPENMEITKKYESKVDEHRWYGLQDIVFEFKLNEEIEYVKTTLVTQSYSEMQSLGDIYHCYPLFKIVKPKVVETIIYEESEGE